MFRDATQVSVKIITCMLSYPKLALFRYCGIKGPSWSEINHFVNFLSDQLELCEKSPFTLVEFVGNVLPGFKSFVVKFMVRMSKVFESVPQSN